jgi:hypothetical protein
MSSPWDVLGPHRGECAFCGAEDARHRIVDSIVEMVTAGDSVESVAEDFGLTVAQVLALVRYEHLRPRLFEHAARAYVAARIANDDAEPRDWTARAAELDRTWHELLEAFEYGATVPYARAVRAEAE